MRYLLLRRVRGRLRAPWATGRPEVTEDPVETGVEAADYVAGSVDGGVITT
jgi:hypothetical protein